MTLPIHRIYFKTPRGELTYGNLVGQSLKWLDGVLDTNSPALIGVAQADKQRNPNTLVEAIEELATGAPAKPIVSTRKIDQGSEDWKRCLTCQQFVLAVEWEAHRAQHGREVNVPAPLPAASGGDPLEGLTGIERALAFTQMKAAQNGEVDPLILSDERDLLNQPPPEPAPAPVKKKGGRPKKKD